MAVTGAQCLASCLLTPGTVADGMIQLSHERPITVILEHTSGLLDITIDYDIGPNGFKLNSAGLIRTARKLAEGKVFIPSSIWTGHPA